MRDKLSPANPGPKPGQLMSLGLQGQGRPKHQPTRAAGLRIAAHSFKGEVMSSMTRTVIRAMTPEARAELGYPPLTRSYRPKKIGHFAKAKLMRRKANKVARKSRRINRA